MSLFNRTPVRRAQVPSTGADWPRDKDKLKLSLLDKIKIAQTARRVLNSIPKPMKINGSWKTSLFGASGLITIVFNVASMLMDEDPNTNPDWSVMLPLLMTSIGALFAKDSNVSNAQNPKTVAEKVE